MRVVYVSHNALKGSDAKVSEEIDQILDTARTLNRQAGITGALMFNRGLFAQVLEGPVDMVEATFERIQCDLRHTDVSILSCKPITERSFAHWSMAYIGSRVQAPATLLKIAEETGFDPRQIDGDAVHEALLTLLLKSDTASDR